MLPGNISQVSLPVPFGRSPGTKRPFRGADHQGVLDELVRGYRGLMPLGDIPPPVAALLSDHMARINAVIEMLEMGGDL